jgi:hypothetical protein
VRCGGGQDGSWIDCLDVPRVPRGERDRRHREVRDGHETTAPRQIVADHGARSAFHASHDLVDLHRVCDVVNLVDESSG